jgi:hypothetical protein
MESAAHKALNAELDLLSGSAMSSDPEPWAAWASESGTRAIIEVEEKSDKEPSAGIIATLDGANGVLIIGFGWRHRF